MPCEDDTNAPVTHTALQPDALRPKPGRHPGCVTLGRSLRFSGPQHPGLNMEMMITLTSRAGLSDKCHLCWNTHLQADEGEGDAPPLEVSQELPEPQHHRVIDAADVAALQDRAAWGGHCRDRRVGHPGQRHGAERGQRELQPPVGRGQRTQNSSKFPSEGAQAPFLPKYQPPEEGLCPWGKCWARATLAAHRQWAPSWMRGADLATGDIAETPPDLPDSDH